eukprot:TRINITY_DN3188_c0_g1_i1.p1 TRINITY_DN3188_c0_g1~~TRINITY_DN3188_c0_g1_i1.p1  ORF type:complete len:653 (-),score=94.88 TRINITY_DN3188_c0_g1_i1:2606-4564(-)
MSRLCLNPFIGGNCKGPPTDSGFLPSISEKLELKLCSLALSQCQRERVILKPNQHDQISLSNIPRNPNEEQNDEGYFTFYGCGQPPECLPENQVIKIEQPRPDLQGQKFREIVGYSQATIESYANYLSSQFFKEQNDVTQEKPENQVKMVAEFVSRILGGVGKEADIAQLWKWHTNLTQQEKDWLVLDVSELKVGTSHHRATLFLLLWWQLRLKSRLEIRPQQKEDEKNTFYPVAELIITIHKNGETNGNSNSDEYVVDLMEVPGSMVLIRQFGASSSNPNPTDFCPDASGVQENPFKKFKTFKDVVWKVALVLKFGGCMPGSQDSDNHLQIGGMVPNGLSETDSISTQQTSTGLSTQWYKMKKFKPDDVKIVSQIGQGGFGIVYRGKLFGNQTVAVKTLLRTATQESEERMRQEFKRELFMLGWLTHPCIVTLMGVLVPEEKESISMLDYAIVMEYVDKGSLYDILHNRSIQLPLWKRLNIVFNACQAVQFLHHYQVEHRDITSKNILVDSAYRGKLSDFGLSETRELIITSNDSKAFVHGNILYMPPEALGLKKNENVQIDGKAVDVYSMGVVIWEASISEKPWEGYSTAAIYTKVAQTKATLPLEKIPEESVRELVGKCWKQNPEERTDFIEICSTLGKIVRDLNQRGV